MLPLDQVCPSSIQLPQTAQRLWRRSIALTLSSTLAIALVGCGESKVAQCNKLIEVVNRGQKIGQGLNEKPDAATMKKLATDLATLSQDIDKVELKDEKLTGYKTRFGKIYQDLGKAASTVGGALDELGKLKKPDAATLKKSQTLKTDVETASKTGDKAAKDEEALVKEVNSYCSGK